MIAEEDVEGEIENVLEFIENLDKEIVKAVIFIEETFLLLQRF